MAKRGLIDRRLAKVKELPFCPGCQYGKQSRKKWRSKGSKSGNKNKIRKASQPGKAISIDTMTFVSVPGLMPQLKGKCMTKRFHYATVL